jgi:Ca-activated chloride channel family protein
MTFTWPAALAALALVPAAVAGYLAILAGRARRRASLAGRSLVLTAGSTQRSWKRHVPAGFLLAALTLLLVSIARPQVDIGIPRREGTVILAFDVSNSMLATDLQPSRLDAAKEAARRFVERQPPSIRIGVVAFGDGGLAAQSPTHTQADVLAAIDRLSPQGGTSLGQGIFASLNEIAGEPLALDEDQLQGDLDSVRIGYYGNAVIVLLSDGEQTAEADPLALAELASVAGVRIHAIGVGSPAGTVIEVDGFSTATALDEATLTAIADVTDGRYYPAADAVALREIYDTIDLQFTTAREPTEVTSLLTAAAAGLLVVGGALSLWWFGRVL